MGFTIRGGQHPWETLIEQSSKGKVEINDSYVVGDEASIYIPEMERGADSSEQRGLDRQNCVGMVERFRESTIKEFVGSNEHNICKIA